jgi:uncharacterized protein (DUF1015 family)
MYFINPFRGLRPTKENASSVTIASTDHLTEDMKKDLLKKNPWNYLNVFNEENKKKSKEKFELMKEKSILIKDKNLSFYFYRISKENFKQVGIVGTAELTAYDNLHIRGHEEIFFERSQKRMKQMDNLNAQIGPIYAVHPDNKALNDLVEKELVNSPIYSFESMDKSKHEMWVVNDEKKVLKICDLFNSINRIYIADGHHRMDALFKLSKIKKHKNPNHTGKEAYNYFMIAMFPTSQARILDYNRLIKDLYGYSYKDFIKEVKKKFKVEKQNSSFKPKKSQIFGMYLDKQWYSLELKEKPHQNLFHIINLDINLLHYYLLEPTLGIGDPRYDNRIDFLAGFHGLEGIEKKVDSREAEVGFALFPTQIENVISFADKRLNMPPKSTWFDPKPLDGIVAYDFE